MRNKVKGGSGRTNRTRVSSKHQVTIPIGAFRAAGLKPGDAVEVEADGPGRLRLTRLDALLEKYRGALAPGAVTADDIERLRSEWR